METEEDIVQIPQQTGPMFCSRCSSTFSGKSSLLKHLRNRHGVHIKFSPKPRAVSASYMCEECGEAFTEKSLHVQHQARHRNPEKYEIKQARRDNAQLLYFLSVSGFQQWKTEVEDAANVRFVKSRGHLQKGNEIVQTFECHRSGDYHPKGHNIRQLKTQGSVKMGKKCPANIVAWTHPYGLKVKYCPTHTHDLTDDSHLEPRQANRNEIDLGGTLACSAEQLPVEAFRSRKYDNKEGSDNKQRFRDKIHELTDIVTAATHNDKLVRAATDKLDGIIAMARAIEKQPAIQVLTPTFVPEPSNKCSETQHRLMASRSTKKRQKEEMIAPRVIKVPRQQEQSDDIPRSLLEKSSVVIVTLPSPADYDYQQNISEFGTVEHSYVTDGETNVS